MAGYEDRILVLITGAAGGLITELQKSGRAAEDAEGHASNLAKTMKTTLVAGAAAFIGTGIVGFLQDSAEAYSDAAKQAGELAGATGGSIENVSRLTAALEDAGIGADEARNMLTKFTTNATGKNKDLLDELNVTLKTGKDGHTDYADAAVQTYDAIMKIGDASERNRALVEAFGKQGAAKLQELMDSGISLKEAMEQIDMSRVFTEEDRRKAAEYDEAIDDMNASFEGVQYAVGRFLVPAMADAAGALTGVIEFLGEIPGETYLVVGAAVAINAAFKSELVIGALRSVGLFTLQTLLNFGLVAAGAISMSEVVAGAMAAMKAALLANPLTAALVVLTSGIVAIQMASQNATDEVREMIPVLKDFEDQGLSTADALTKTSEKWLDTASGWDKTSLMWENWGWAKNLATLGLWDVMTDDAAEAQKNLEDKLSDLRAEMGEYAFDAEQASASQKSLNDLVAQGVTDMERLGPAVETAAEQQHEHNVETELAKGLMEAYASATWDAVDATESMFDAQHRAESAQSDLTEAVKRYNEERSAENAQAVVDAAWDLAEASTAAWAAEEKRYGAYVTQEQMDAHKLQLLAESITQLPSGSAAAQQLMTEFARELAAFAVANPATIPVGIEPPDVAAAIATLQTALAAEKDPEKKVHIQADIDTLTQLKTDIETGARTEVTTPVKGDTTQLEGDIATATDGTTATVNVTTAGMDKVKSELDAVDDWRETRLTVNLAGADDVRSQYDALDDWRETRLNLTLAGADEVERRLNQLDDWKDIVYTVKLAGDGDVERRLNQLDDWRTVRITVETAGVAAAAAAIASLSASPSVQRIVIPPPAPVQPVNIVKVSVDGQQLRATIRDELMSVRRSDDLVAAMGTVA